MTSVHAFCLISCKQAIRNSSRVEALIQNLYSFIAHSAKMFQTAHFTLSYGVRQIFISMVITYLLAETTAGSYSQTTVPPKDSLHNSSSLQECRDGYTQLSPEQRLRCKSTTVRLFHSTFADL